MADVCTPRTIPAATQLLERYASLEATIVAAENARNAVIAEANKAADESLAPLLEERRAILSKLEPWWLKNATKLTAGKRKSIELGGCMIGTRVGRASLGVDGDEDAIVKKLEARPWAKLLLRVTTKLDKKAVLAATDGEHKKRLAALGLKKNDASVTFFVERAEQAGTRAAA